MPEDAGRQGHLLNTFLLPTVIPADCQRWDFETWPAYSLCSLQNTFIASGNKYLSNGIGFNIWQSKMKLQMNQEQLLLDQSFAFSLILLSIFF